MDVCPVRSHDLTRQETRSPWHACAWDEMARLRRSRAAAKDALSWSRAVRDDCRLPATGGPSLARPLVGLQFQPGERLFISAGCSCSRCLWLAARSAAPANHACLALLRLCL